MQGGASTPKTDAEEERDGIQWHNVGPALGVFALSVLLSYVVAKGAGWPRMSAALQAAGLQLFFTMVVARYAVRLLPVGRLFGSIKVFAGVWLAVVAVWALAFAR